MKQASGLRAKPNLRVPSRVNARQVLIAASGVDGLPRRIMKLLSILPFLVLLPLATKEAEALPQTQPLVWEEADLSSRLMDGAHQFVERKIAEAPAKRAALWVRDFSSPEAYAK